MTLESEGFVFRQARFDELEAVFDLRWRVLRQPHNNSRGAEQDEFDYRMRTIHGGAFLNGLLVSTGRMHVIGDNQELRQLCFMATEEYKRGKGLGSGVLHFMEVEAAETGAREVRLNACVDALQFYMRAGYELVSERSFIEYGVEHNAMKKVLR